MRLQVNTFTQTHLTGVAVPSSRHNFIYKHGLSQPMHHFKCQTADEEVLSNVRMQHFAWHCAMLPVRQSAAPACPTARMPSCSPGYATSLEKIQIVAYRPTVQRQSCFTHVQANHTKASLKILSSKLISAKSI